MHSLSLQPRNTAHSKFVDRAAALLVLLFLYTAVSKLLDWHEFQSQIKNQAIPAWSKGPVTWLLPPAEILVSVLLLFKSARLAGFLASAVLLLLFSAYILLVLAGFFNRVPCSCGGVIGELSWQAHLILNLFFLLLSLSGIYFTYRERRSVGKE